ncbi:MAG: hemolysin family protein [Paraprevotella sp.]|nr:hemolysin family protein [Paraprevotella sp.]
MTSIIQIVFILLLSAFFSGMEIAFVSSNKLKFEVDRSSQSLTTKIVSVFYSHPNNFISTLLVGNNIALVIYGILMAQVINRFILTPIHLTDNEGIMLTFQTVISTFIVLITGEFLPKTLFKINPNRMMNVFAIPAMLFYILLYPVSKFTSGLSKVMLRLLGLKVTKQASDQAFTKVDLDYFIQSSIKNVRSEEAITDEVKIFRNALDFSNIKVRDCIVPRTEIEAIDIDSPVEMLRNHFIESGNSKIVVYEGDIDNIVGFIHSSEMFRHPQDWTKQIREVPIVPETMPAHKMLQTFMQQKKSLAVVVDEFGGTSGIVTMEDLVEEIFGDIEDEHDNNNYVAKTIGENEYILSARLEIEKANEILNIQLPESDDYLTVGGLILHQYQSFPKLNEIVKFGPFEFKIIKNTTTKIELVRLKISE